MLPSVLEKASKKGPRSSVSAEAFGAWNKKSDFKPRVVKKTDDTMLKISNRLKQSFLFSSLN
jgi:cAMP-dependent protein kinase regulator